MVNIYTVKSFFAARIGCDPSKKITVTDWLTFPQQRLLELVSGGVFHDGLGKLQAVREKLRYYPHDVWLYLLAAQWTRISQEEAFIGRAGEVGDELGSQITAARMAREIVRLSFLMEKKYIPYSKWLGRAFSKLKIADKLNPILIEVFSAKTWTEREKKLAQAYSVVARQHNALKLTEPLPTEASSYYGRPYLVIHGDNFARAISEKIKDFQVKRIKTAIGSIDQFTDSTDVVQNLSLLKRLGTVYEAS
jgi:hypothetical protein